MFVYGIVDVFGILLLVFIGALSLVSGFLGWRKERKCRHESYRESTACDAICRGCGKNLGFIGNLRD